MIGIGHNLVQAIDRPESTNSLNGLKNISQGWCEESEVILNPKGIMYKIHCLGLKKHRK